MASYFSNKCKVPIAVEANVVYKFKCHGCEAVYIGETERHLHYRCLQEHRQLSRKSAILDHNLTCNKRSSNLTLNEFSIIAKRFTTKKLRQIREAIEIKSAGETLNVQNHNIGDLLAVFN